MTLRGWPSTCSFDLHPSLFFLSQTKIPTANLNPTPPFLLLFLSWTVFTCVLISWFWSCLEYDTCSYNCRLLSLSINMSVIFWINCFVNKKSKKVDHCFLKAKVISCLILSTTQAATISISNWKSVEMSFQSEESNRKAELLFLLVFVFFSFPTLLHH